MLFVWKISKHIWKIIDKTIESLHMQKMIIQDICNYSWFMDEDKTKEASESCCK